MTLTEAQQAEQLGKIKNWLNERDKFKPWLGNIPVKARRVVVPYSPSQAVENALETLLSSGLEYSQIQSLLADRHAAKQREKKKQENQKQMVV